HLAGDGLVSEEDMKDFEAFGDVADELPGAPALASPHRLPSHLRARVLRAVESRAGRSRRLMFDRAWLRPLGVAAALVLAVALVTWNLELQQGLAQERSLLQQLRDSAGQQSVIFEVVDSSGSQKVSLKAVGPQRPGEDPPYGKVYANPQQTQIVAMGGRLPAPDANEEYRLYVTDRFGTTANVGVLRSDTSGFGYLAFATGAPGAAATSPLQTAAPRTAAPTTAVTTAAAPSPVPTAAPPTPTLRPAPQTDRIGFPDDYQTKFKFGYAYDRRDAKSVSYICLNDV